jgi:hypothetical protein
LTTVNRVVENILRKNTEFGDNMRLYSKKNKEDLFDIFEIHLHLPIIKWGTRPGDAWINNYPTKFLDINFDTTISYRKDEVWTYFELTLIGFGFSITRQTGY